MKYTIEEALEYSKNSKINEWLQLFLRDTNRELGGSNIPLANGLLLEERFYYGPVLFDLDKITTKRTETDLEGNELDWYNKVVDRMSNDFDGSNFPPLIIEFKDNKFYLVDGNHRFSSLKRNGKTKYYSIIWGNKDKENEFFEVLNQSNKRLK